MLLVMIMVYRKIRLNEYILVIFALFTFLKPAGFDFLGFDAINLFLNIARIITAVITIFVYFKYFSGISKFIKYEIGFFVVLGLSTLFNDNDVNRFFIFSISVISLSMLLEILIKRNVILLVKSLFFCYFVIISINLLYMLSTFGFVINIEEKLPEVFKMGVPVSLLSSVNGTASFLFPALVSSVLLFSISNVKNKWGWLLILNIFVTVLILWSATSLTGVFLIICYILFVYRKKSEKKINTFILAITTIVVSLGITFFNIQYLFSYIIVNILQKDLTMTGRTNVWKIGQKGFESSPLIGCGFDSQTIDNGYIQLLFNSGCIGLIFFSVLMIWILIKCKRYNNISLTKFMTLCLSIVFLMFTSESWPFFFGIYILFLLAYYSVEISKKISTIKYYFNHINNETN